MIFGRKQKRRESVVGLDLGVRQIKAVLLRREGATLKLARYATGIPASPANKANPVEQYAAEIRRVLDKLDFAERSVRVTISCPSAMICEAEIQRMSREEVRSALKLSANSLRYLRRDLSDHYLDVQEVSEGATEDAAKRSPTMRVLVGGAAREDVNWYCAALELAKVEPEVMELAALSVVNAFQVTCAELCSREVVCLVDIGSQFTNINILRQGQPALTRIMQFGGENLTLAVSQALGVEPKVAEEEKLRLDDNLQTVVRQALVPLVREVRSSIDFFERQQDCHVGKVLACGGTACSFTILDWLAEETGVSVQPWNPVEKLETAHFNGEAPKLAAVAPSLAAAIGVAAPIL